MIRVYADMVGDLFHHGHVAFLRRARELGDVLVVGVHSDEAVAGYKARPVLTMEERLQVVAACRYVDEVLADAPIEVGGEWIERHRIDLVVHGDDIGPAEIASWYAEPQARGILRIVPYTTEISSREIVARIERRLADGDGSS